MYNYGLIQSVAANDIPRTVALSADTAAFCLQALTAATFWYQWIFTTNPPTPSEWDTIEAFVGKATNEMMNRLVGYVIPWPGETIPTYALACDGGTYNRVDYPLLYAMLDSAFILDADTFQTPDLRSRSIVGAGQGVGLSNRVMGESGGQENHVLSENEMPSHNHFYTPPAVDIDLEGVGAPIPAATVGLATTTSNTGGGQAHENMHPFLVLQWIVIAQ